jgi:hypothetical protein
VSRPLAIVALAAALSTGAAGCYKTNFHMKPGPGLRSTSVDDKLHFSVISLVEVSKPVRLDTACSAGGPVMVNEQISGLAWLINYLLPVLSAFSVSVDCTPGAPATPGAPPAPAPIGGAPPAR